MMFYKKDDRFLSDKGHLCMIYWVTCYDVTYYDSVEKKLYVDTREDFQDRNFEYIGRDQPIDTHDLEKAIEIFNDTVRGAEMYRIPKKVLVDDRDYPDGKKLITYGCPTCETLIWHTNTKYCSNCGQALDWSEVMENAKEI